MSLSHNGEQSGTAPTPAATRLTRRAFLQGALVVVGATATGAGLVRLPLPTADAQGAADVAKPTIYLIATAHNDTQWNWTVQHTIRDCIPATMRPNWELFEKYPDYNFNYEGVVHYMFFKEYHPEDWPELQSWVQRGRWKLSGSWINAVDVCNPSAESLFRQALYGQQFFRREFGQVSRDIYLPDCFGFPYSLPTIGRHSGLIAFSTQKFDLWGGWRPTPFDVGRWRGVDGSELVSALKPGPYDTHIHDDIARDPHWTDDFSLAGDRQVDLRYFGTGDQGGTPPEESVAWAQKAVRDTDAPVRVINTSNDQIAKDLTPAEIAALPVYDGELVMKQHGVGAYTSQAARKKWNRLNEQLADAAERASLASAWLGGPAYPQDALYGPWIRTLWHQFHDDLPGTCIPQAYTFSWNDDLLNVVQFSQIVTAGVGGVAQHLDTRTQGVPLVIYNPLDQPRRECVEATVTLPHAAPAVRVFDQSTGAEIASQVLSRDGDAVTLLLLADVPPVGCRVYDVRPSAVPCALKTGLTVTPAGLESSRYRVAVNADGDISGVYDKETQAELLSAPSQMQYFRDYSPAWPAWEILWDTVSSPPLGVITSPRVRVTEHGPVRVALEVTRTLGESTFVQHIRLTPDGDWVEVYNEVDWQTPGTLVKATFPMTAANPLATFDLGLGTIERPNHQPNLYEVNGQQWAGISDIGGGHGMAVLTWCKYGWDKPADDLLRLSVIRTPAGDGNYPHQYTNDIGRHQYSYALAGHAGDWRAGHVPQRAARFNQPLRAFQTARHAGAGGHSFSLLHVSTDQVRVGALKKAEDGDEWVVRLQELEGRPAQGVTVTFAAPVVSVREINAAEESVGPYQTQGGKLVLDLTAYQPRSFAVRLAAAPHKTAPIASSPVALPYNLDGITLHAGLTNGAFDSAGQTYAGELWPAHLTADGVPFHLGGCAPGAKNMVACRGQKIRLPAGGHNRLYLLAASAEGDQSGVFTVHAPAGQTTAHTVRVQDWAQHVGQWDSRLLHPSSGDGGSQVVSEVQDGKVVGIEHLRPGYVKRDNVAWVGTHRHGPDGDQAYLYSYLFKYRLDLPPGATAVTLPDAPNIRVMAMTVADNHVDDTVPAGLMYEPRLGAAPPVYAPHRHVGPATVVFRQDALQTYDGTGPGLTAVTGDDLPIAQNAAWTINLFVRTDQAPGHLTTIGGFGDDSDTQGTQRYLISFDNSIEFWASNIDINSGVPLDLGKWQMLTATYNGKTVRVYKNGASIASQEAALEEAAPVVKIAPPGPWDNGHRFAGEIQHFTIWNGALTPAQIQDLLASMPSG